MKENRKDFLKRSKKTLTGTSIGSYHDLNDCVNRLRDQMLIPDNLEFVTGSNPYVEIDPETKEDWFVGHMGESDSATGWKSIWNT